MKNLNIYINEGLFDNIGVGLEHSIEQWFLKHGLEKNDFNIEEINGNYSISFNNENHIFLNLIDENFKSINDVIPYKGLLKNGLPGNLLIRNNKLFNSFDGFPYLITGALSIEKCPNLKSLKGIPDGGIYGMTLSDCKNLSKLDAKLDFCSTMDIINCPKLKNLDDFYDKEPLDYMSLQNCPNLEFDDFKNIIVYDLYIKDCPKLENLKPTKNIKKIIFGK